MRLAFITLIVICVLCLFIIINPVLFIKATEPVLNSEIRENIGVLLTNFAVFTGRYGTAADISDYLISLNPYLPKFYVEKAKYLEKSGKLSEAIIIINEAVKMEPENINYLLMKARLYRSTGQVTISEIVYQQMEKIVPETQQDLVLSGDAALERGNYVTAYRRYTEAAIKNPSDGKTHEKRGDVIFALLTVPTAGLTTDENFRNLDLYSEGIKSYKAALFLIPDRKSEINEKIDKRSNLYVPKSINELQSRYTQYKYLN